MDKDRIAGAAKELKGAIEGAVGTAVGDAKLVSEGKAGKIEGKIQNAVGGLKDAITEATTRSVMAEEANTDVAALQTEIKQLRADFAKIAGTIHDIATNSVASAGQQVQASTDRVWTEVKRQADSVTQEIEKNPIAAALTAFGAGILLGLLLNRHRG